MFVNNQTEDLIGSNLIKDGKVANKKLEKRQGKSKTYNATKPALFWVQVVKTNAFRSNQTK